ncbi:DUF742 domain-containing protein [Streptomyces sp. NPDC056304]|uniref:DUF742 domain-containing protein n=1 Tax=Streptomyces sp. NPDC056304 TaxID=3345778 RepID=UPI0035D9E20D
MVRPYVRTNGRVRPTRPDVRLESLVRAAASPDAALPADSRRVMALVGRARGALGVVEIAAGLDLPPSTVRIIVSELLDSGHLATPINSRPDQPDTSLLEEVLRGLRASL